MSLQCDGHTNILKFYNQISSLNSERYVNNAFYMLANDAESGHSNWVSHVRELQIRYKIQQTDHRSMIKTKVENILNLNY